MNKTWFVCTVLCLAGAQAAHAQSTWVGTYRLSGKQGDRATRVELVIEDAGDGRLKLTRKGRFTQSPHRELAPFTWSVTTASIASSLRVSYPEPKNARGISGALTGADPGTPQTYDAVYTRKAGRIEEVVENQTTWWRTIDTSGVRDQTGDVLAFLEKQSKARPLRRLGAQWHVLRMAHWQIEQSTHGKWRYSLARNPYDADAKHTLRIPVESYRYNPRTPYKLFAYDYGFAGKHYAQVVKAAHSLASWR